MLTSLLWRAIDCWNILLWDMARLVTASAQEQLDFGESQGPVLDKMKSDIPHCLRAAGSSLTALKYGFTFYKSTDAI